VTNQNPNQQAAAALLALLLNAQGQQSGAAVSQSQQPGQVKTKRPTDLTIWQWTLVPVVFVALRILIAAHGNTDTLASLVQNINITAVFLATFLPFIAVAVLLFFMIAVLATIDAWRKREEQEEQGKPRNQFTRNLSVAIILLPFAAVLGWYAMSIKLLIVTSIVIGVLVVLLLGTWFIPNVRRILNVLGGVYLIVLILAALIVPISQQGLCPRVNASPSMAHNPVWSTSCHQMIGGRDS
jgi:hypothetical protein